MSSGDGDSMEVEYIWRHHRHGPRKNQGTSALVRHIKAHMHLVSSLSPHIGGNGDLINDARAAPFDDVVKNFAPSRQSTGRASSSS
ncbi:hypothetical protein ACFX1R_038648 [Malus domestica]